MTNLIPKRKLRVGINGFGRIGRVLTRKISEISNSNLKLVVVNDVESDLGNLAYLLKHDSVYGRFPMDVTAKGDCLFLGENKIDFFCKKNIREVPWERFNLDVLIEATGVKDNVLNSKFLISEKRTRKVVVTNADSSVDHTIIFGVNDQTYSVKKHHVVSVSICDANAIAPVLFYLDSVIGIDSALITTLHPWLSYQNLLDGPVSSVSSPGHNWAEYALGRSSVGNLILKETTAGEATLKVLSKLEGKIEAISFRVPTSNVSASDFAINLKTETTLPEVFRVLTDASLKYPEVIKINRDSLVSSDFTGISHSCVIDFTKAKLLEGKFLKIVTWYDNEWAYSSRVLDVVNLVAQES
jgi:glyceraldehyde 3-phosphate dehydrogenase